MRQSNYFLEYPVYTFLYTIYISCIRSVYLIYISGIHPQYLPCTIIFKINNLLFLPTHFTYPSLNFPISSTYRNLPSIDLLFEFFIVCLQNGGDHGNQYTVASEKIFNLPDTTDTPSTQSELAEKYGITKQTMSNYMRLAKAIPELEELVDTAEIKMMIENREKSLMSM